MEFILFDACLMSSIECMYQLKDKTNMIIASPTDILAYGFPYEYIIPTISKPNINYTEIGRNYMNFYNKKSGILNSGCITIIEIKQVEKLSKNTLYNCFRKKRFVRES